ncbi:MAG: DUF6449 domain-containing protein [Lachnospiraceae bacterium]
MTSKNSFFKLTIEALKSRLWAIALIGLAFFFACPVAVSLAAKSYYYRDDLQQMAIRWLSFGNPGTVFLSIVASIICGMGSFGYLNSKSRVDFYHSLPIRRGKLYLVNYIAGILIFAIPYALMLLAGIAVAVVYGGSSYSLYPEAAIGYILNMLYYTLMYSVVIIAVMMTGNRIIAYLGAMVFNFIAPIAAAVIVEYFPTFFDTWYYGYGSRATEYWRISAITEYINQAGNYRSDGLEIAPLLLAVLVTAALGVLGWVLYRRRPSEAAGRAMTFDCTKPVIRIIIVMVTTLSFALFLWAVNSSIGWAIFGILSGGIISHCVIEIIYHFEFKKLFSHKWQLGGCLLASLLFFCVFRFDWLGFDSYLPKASQISNAAVNVPWVNDWTSYGTIKGSAGAGYYWESESSEKYIFEHMENVDTVAVLSLTEAGILKLKESRETGKEYKVNICYTLNSGRKVYRTYYLSYDDMRDALSSLYIQPAYKEGVYPVMKVTADSVAEVRYREWEPEKRLDTLTAAEKEALLTAYQQDLEQQSLEQLEGELPLGLIRFVTEQELAGLEASEAARKTAERENTYYGNYVMLEERNFYPVYRTFTNTCRLLNQYGIEPGDDLWQMPTEYYQAGIYRFDKRSRDDGDYQEEYTIADQTQINELDAVVSPVGLAYYNPLCEVADIDLVCYKNQIENREEISVVIPMNQMPEFLTALKEQGGELEKGE